MNTHPHHGGTCYACDAASVGLRQLQPGAPMLPACARHADRSIRTFAACCYCNGPVRRGSVTVDGHTAHKGCHRAEAK